MIVKLTGCTRGAIFLLLMINIALYSCSKNNPKEEQQSFPSSITIHDFPESQQKIVYSLFTSEEKFFSWKSHFQHFMAKENLTSPQKLFVMELIQFISPQFFSEPLSYQNERIIVTLRKRGMKLFSKEELFYLMASLHHSSASEVSPEIPASSLVEGGNGCACSRESDWCGGLMACQARTCESQNGCGTFWSYSCDGMCAY